MPPPLFAVLLLLAVAFAAAACGMVEPATGPQTFGDGRSNSSA